MTQFLSALKNIFVHWQTLKVLIINNLIIILVANLNGSMEKGDYFKFQCVWVLSFQLELYGLLCCLHLYAYSVKIFANSS